MKRGLSKFDIDDPLTAKISVGAAIWLLPWLVLALIEFAAYADVASADGRNSIEALCVLGAVACVMFGSMAVVFLLQMIIDVI